jgi:hypothetical protein
MNVIIYWDTGDYADVYNVDEVRRPSKDNPDLRLFRKIDKVEFEVARFKGEEIRGWQIFLTVDDRLED